MAKKRNGEMVKGERVKWQKGERAKTARTFLQICDFAF